MSDDERLDLRDQAPLPPLSGWRERYSQTLLAKADKCLHQAYLYVKYNGGAPGHQLDRGTAFHLFAERLMKTLVATGEVSLVAPGHVQDPETGEAVAEDPVLAARQVASLTAAMVDDILFEHRELTVPRGEADDIRAMAYHLAVGNDIDPAKVVAIERKFVIDLGGHEVSGKIDVAQLAGDVAQVDDYKTSFNVPDQEAFEDTFQGWLYALLLLFGYPVEKVPCSKCAGKPLMAAGDVLHVDGDPRELAATYVAAMAEKANVRFLECAECGGRGYTERREECIGDRVQWVRVRMLFPRYLLDDGTIQQRHVTLSRAQVNDFRHDVERTIARLDGARESGKFPAVAGAHCNECPCAAECPLPKHLRRWAGAINDADQAAEAAEWLEVWKPRIAATEKEVKNWANAHGPLRYGRDKVREFVVQEGRAVKQVKGRAAWDELAQAVVLAAEFGEPFELGEWVRSTSSMRFVSRTLTPEELEEQGGAREEVAARDFGEDPPF